MITTQVTTTIGKPKNIYCLLALLSKSTQQQLAPLLASLSTELGDDAWVMPETSLHITLCEIIEWKEYAHDRQAMYDQHSYKYENLTEEILANFGPISVTFDTIEVSPQAIIIKGSDDGSFARIRKELVEKLPLPENTKMPPAIIHSSIVRFVNEVPLSKIEEIVQRHSISISETVNQFHLIHSLVSPLLDYETIRRYSLIKD